MLKAANKPFCQHFCQYAPHVSLPNMIKIFDTTSGTLGAKLTSTVAQW